MINEYSIPLPDNPEQLEIVAILQAIDCKIDLHRRKRAVLEELFKALLHNLMTGKIRVGEWGFMTMLVMIYPVQKVIGEKSQELYNG